MIHVGIQYIDLGISTTFSNGTLKELLAGAAKVGNPAVLPLSGAIGLSGCARAILARYEVHLAMPSFLAQDLEQDMTQVYQEYTDT